MQSTAERIIGLTLGQRYRAKGGRRMTCIVTKIESKTAVTITLHTLDRSHYPAQDILDETAFRLLYEPAPEDEADDAKS